MRQTPAQKAIRKRLGSKPLWDVSVLWWIDIFSLISIGWLLALGSYKYAAFLCAFNFLWATIFLRHSELHRDICTKDHEDTLKRWSASMDALAKAQDDNRRLKALIELK